jgi:MFS transporter, VNT family, synaptic vesicle glycoprotein 2
VEIKLALCCPIKINFFIFSLYMFFPEILNRMADYTKVNPNPSITVCEILDATRSKYSELSLNNNTELNHVCITKLELSTYEHTFVLEALYALGFAIIGVIINFTGKLPIILFVLFGCGSCAISLIFVNIPLISTYLYVLLLSCGLAINVVNASTIELYPTSLR